MHLCVLLKKLSTYSRDWVRSTNEYEHTKTGSYIQFLSVVIPHLMRDLGNFISGS